MEGCGLGCLCLSSDGEMLRMNGLLRFVFCHVISCACACCSILVTTPAGVMTGLLPPGLFLLVLNAAGLLSRLLSIDSNPLPFSPRFAEPSLFNSYVVWCPVRGGVRIR
eukprot:GHVL01030384.1.p1 GENE.GHVL01030384.1~~GHVL01030384.1.p1  ORF type:complete len:109 (-),score=0.55 GHVL01030384.1:260-586(-)